jgi:hypothetical protein
MHDYELPTSHDILLRFGSIKRVLRTVSKRRRHRRSKPHTEIMEPGQLMHLEWNGASCWCRCDHTEEKSVYKGHLSRLVGILSHEVLGGVNQRQMPLGRKTQGSAEGS